MASPDAARATLTRMTWPLKWLSLFTISLAVGCADPARAQTVDVCAHRGWLEPSQPENSLEQFARTAAAGIPWIEVDLGTSADGTLYLLHDATLERSTSGRGRLRQMRDAQLETVRLRTGDRISNEALPTFAQLLKWAQASGTRLLVDLKDGAPESAAALLRQAGLIDRVIFLSFSPESDRRALASDPDVRVSMLVSDRAAVDAAVQRADGHPMALYVPHDADASLFEYAARTGQPVITDAMSSLDLEVARTGSTAYQEFVRRRPVSILVSDRPLEAMRALR
ncbi:MAG: glycerophosphodiester phosphodiesterase family protein [Vicinamibacterales bacterium]